MLHPARGQRLRLNAGDIGQVLATVHLPRRIPAGFHGAWVDADGRQRPVDGPKGSHALQPS